MSLDSAISFYVEGIAFELTHPKEISSWLTTIAVENNASLSQIEYIFCSDEYLLDINKQYLNHDYYTDIITFPMKTDPVEATIFISIDRIREQAIEYKATFLDELHRVVVHGLLHLIGFNDKTEEEQDLMTLQEDACLEKRDFV